MNPLLPQLPKGFTLLENQVAGHTFSPDTQALGLLKDESFGYVLKPMGKPQCGERELSFYESIAKTTDPLLIKVRDLVPKFYDKLKLEVNSKEHTFLKMEDLSHGMQKPCIMDIKIGKRTWDPLSSPRKRQVEEQKYLQTKQVLGLCLPGFQVYNNGVLQKYNRDYGKQLDAAGLRETIRKFLKAEQKVCQPLVREVLNQLYSIREWFQKQTLLHFYASSLLIVYDCEALVSIQYAQHTGTLLINGDADEAQFNSSNHVKSSPPEQESPFNQLIFKNTQYAKPQQLVKVRMIDFAHVFPAEDKQLDSNYLFGLENLIRIVEELGV